MTRELFIDFTGETIIVGKPTFNYKIVRKYYDPDEDVLKLWVIKLQ